MSTKLAELKKHFERLLENPDFLEALKDTDVSDARPAGEVLEKYILP